MTCVVPGCPGCAYCRTEPVLVARIQARTEGFEVLMKTAGWLALAAHAEAEGYPLEAARLRLLAALRQYGAARRLAEPVTDEDRLVDLVRRYPGRAAWRLHDLARRQLEWRGYSTQIADRLRALRQEGRVRWEESECQAVWYVS